MIWQTNSNPFNFSMAIIEASSVPSQTWNFFHFIVWWGPYISPWQNAKPFLFSFPFSYIFHSIFKVVHFHFRMVCLWDSKWQKILIYGSICQLTFSNIQLDDKSFDLMESLLAVSRSLEIAKINQKLCTLRMMPNWPILHERYSCVMWEFCGWTSCYATNFFKIFLLFFYLNSWSIIVV